MPAHSRMFTAVLRSALPLITVACVHDSLVAPVGRQAPAPVRSVSGPIGSQVFPVKPYNENWDNPGTPFQDTLVWGGMPVNATLRITVSGTVTLGPPPTLSGFTMTRNTTYMGQSIGPKGITGIYSTYGVPLQVHAGIINPAYGLTIDSATGDGSIILRTGPSASALVLQRNGIAGEWQCTSPQAPPGQIRQATCDDGNAVLVYTHPGYYRTSQQTVSVDRLDDDVTLNAVASTGGKGRNVTFTAVPLAANGGGGPMGWSFTPDSGTSTAATCLQGPSVNPCVAVINATGWMDVNWYFSTALLDGEHNRHAKTHVWAVDCPQTDTAVPHDSLINRNDIRQLMKAVYDSSGPNLDIFHKHEEGEYVYRNPDTDSLIVIPWNTPSDPCSIQVPMWPASPPLSWMIAVIHSHPAAPGDSLPPNVCTLDPHNKQGGKIGPGPSGDDDQVYDQVGASVYAVDRNDAWRTQGKRHHIQWPRQSSCTLF